MTADLNTLKERGVRWYKAKQAAIKAKEELDNATTHLVEALDDAEQASVSFALDTDKITCTRAQNKSIVIDEDRLKKVLGAPTFHKVTKEVLDKTKLEEAVLNGSIDPNAVATCSEEKLSEPYIRHTVKKGVVKIRQRSEAAKQIGRSPVPTRPVRKKIRQKGA